MLTPFFHRNQQYLRALHYVPAQRNKIKQEIVCWVYIPSQELQHNSHQFFSDFSFLGHG